MSAALILKIKTAFESPPPSNVIVPVRAKAEPVAWTPGAKTCPLLSPAKVWVVARAAAAL